MFDGSLSTPADYKRDRPTLFQVPASTTVGLLRILRDADTITHRRGQKGTCKTCKCVLENLVTWMQSRKGTCCSILVSPSDLLFEPLDYCTLTVKSSDLARSFIRSCQIIYTYQTRPVKVHCLFTIKVLIVLY